MSSPNFSTGGFDPVTGVFTVPETGRYELSLSCNVDAPAPIGVSLGPGPRPALAIHNLTTVSDLSIGRISILNVDMLFFLTLRAPVFGEVSTESRVQLNAGDEVAALYIADGMTLLLDFEDCRFSATRLD